MTKIAYRVGFKDPSHFTRRFKARFGVSPNEYRRGAEARAAGERLRGIAVTRFGLSRRSQNALLARRDSRMPPPDNPTRWTPARRGRTFNAGDAMRNAVRPVSNFFTTLATSLALGALALPAPALGQAANVGVLEVSVDPAFPATFGQELKLRVRISNLGAAAATGVALDAKAGAVVVGHVDVGVMGPGEQRTITLATHFKPAGADCVSVVPVVAPDSPVKAGPSRLACLTPGCYSLSERPGS